MREDNEVIQGEHEMQNRKASLHSNGVLVRVRSIEQCDLLKIKPTESEGEVEE